MNTWPDAGTTPYRNEKNSSWEGAYRVPCLVRFPGHIEAGSESNEIVSHLDWFPTILAAAGEPDIKEKLKKGYKIGKRTFKVHLDGYNLVPYLTGKEKKSPRPGFIYFTDEGDVAALRFDNWKMLFMEQRVSDGRFGHVPATRDGVFRRLLSANPQTSDPLRLPTTACGARTAASVSDACQPSSWLVALQLFALLLSCLRIRIQ